MSAAGGTRPVGARDRASTRKRVVSRWPRAGQIRRSRHSDRLLCNSLYSKPRIMSRESIESFLDLLKESPAGAVFSPWWQVDKKNDIGPRAPQIRREQLRAYLVARRKKSRLAIVGEALGYRGGHFTGIAMTSERILLGGNKIDGLEPEQICL